MPKYTFTIRIDNPESIPFTFISSQQCHPIPSICCATKVITGKRYSYLGENLSMSSSIHIIDTINNPYSANRTTIDITRPLAKIKIPSVELKTATLEVVRIGEWLLRFDCLQNLGFKMKNLYTECFIETDNLFLIIGSTAAALNYLDPNPLTATYLKKLFFNSLHMLIALTNLSSINANRFITTLLAAPALQPKATDALSYPFNSSFSHFHSPSLKNSGDETAQSDIKLDRAYRAHPI